MRPYEPVSVLGLIDDVMDKNELIKREEKGGDMTKPEEPKKPEEVKLPSAYRNGMFYLFVFVVVFCLIALFGGKLELPYLVLTIVSTALFLVIIGALQLKNDERFSDDSFLELMKLVIEQLPLIGNVVKQLTSKDE